MQSQCTHRAAVNGTMSRAFVCRLTDNPHAMNAVLSDTQVIAKQHAENASPVFACAIPIPQPTCAQTRPHTRDWVRPACTQSRAVLSSMHGITYHPACAESCAVRSSMHRITCSRQQRHMQQGHMQLHAHNSCTQRHNVTACRACILVPKPTATATENQDQK